MIKVLDNVITRMHNWPKARQQDAARILEAMERTGTTTSQLSDTERAAIQEGLDEAKRGDFVSDTDMQAFWNRREA